MSDSSAQITSIVATSGQRSTFIFDARQTTMYNTVPQILATLLFGA